MDDGHMDVFPPLHLPEARRADILWGSSPILYCTVHGTVVLCIDRCGESLSRYVDSRLDYRCEKIYFYRENHAGRQAQKRYVLW